MSSPPSDPRPDNLWASSDEPAATDFPLDGCLPYVAPLRTLRDECAVPTERLPYVYDGIERDWVEPARVGA